MDKTLRLPDGRALGYCEYGDPLGTPLFYIHGHPGSRLEAGFLADAAAKHHARLIGVDQPGLGLSTYRPRRTLLDWPYDLVALADTMNIDRFAVVGFSGGGPHALACAYKISGRLTSCGIVSGVGRSTRRLSFLGSWLPWIVLPLTKRHFANEGAARTAMARLTRRWPEPDRDAYEQPWVRAALVASLVESFRQGIKGAAYEGKLIAARHWGFELEDISMDVHLWHGGLDDQVPVAEAEASTKRLPHCDAVFYPNEAHISTIVNHGDEIVGILTDR
jgi:pimeloyl-ACP methyl ester carboxylesterase